MSNDGAKYTQEQLDIALLKNTNEGIFRTFQDIKDQLREMKSDIKTQGHLNLGLILGIYAMIGAASLAKIFGLM